jgi:hypothetical protein
MALNCEFHLSAIILYHNEAAEHKCKIVDITLNTEL